MPYDGPYIDWTSGSTLISSEEMEEYIIALGQDGLSDEQIVEKLTHLACVFWYFIGINFGVDPFSIILAERNVDKSLTTSAETVFPPQNMVRSEHAKSEERSADD